MYLWSGGLQRAGVRGVVVRIGMMCHDYRYIIERPWSKCFSLSRRLNTRCQWRLVDRVVWCFCPWSGWVLPCWEYAPQMLHFLLHCNLGRRLSSALVGIRGRDRPGPGYLSSQRCSMVPRRYFQMDYVWGIRSVEHKAAPCIYQLYLLT